MIICKTLLTRERAKQAWDLSNSFVEIRSHLTTDEIQGIDEICKHPSTNEQLGWTDIFSA